MPRTLWLQCDTGISGDMVVGALLDAGADAQGLMRALSSLPVEGFEISITKKRAGAFVGTDFDVVVDEAHENHDHDMEWLYGDVDTDHGHDHGHGHAHVHDHEQDHVHEHHHHAHGHHHGDDHEHGHHHDHVHRNLADIVAIVEGADLSDGTRDVALRIFEVIAEAEAKAHGETVESVHFHEVGAVDSIVDVIACAWCLDDLGIDDVYVSALAEGEGHVRCAHGVLPIPVPAVANICEAYGLVLRRTHRMGELVTPTGAAIAAATRTIHALPELYRIVSVGRGTGKRAYEVPSVVVATIVEEASEDTAPEPVVWKLETEVDDCTGEALGYTLDRLFEAGAREAHFVPVFMKKGRPAYQVEVICDDDRIADIENVLFCETTTIGIRRYPVERTTLAREAITLETELGEMGAKVVTLPDGSRRTYLEHESVANVAREQGLSYQEVLARGRQEL